MYCDHSKQLTDNYGISCARCGQVLEGFGYGRFVGENLATEPVCIHKAWFRLSSLEEECLYCHEVRPRLDPVH
jgi:hypothetical protein